MTIMPTFHFITAIILFGLLFYLYSPIVQYLEVLMPVSGVWATAMFWLWGILAVINLLGSGIRLLMKYQELPTGVIR